MTVSAIPLSRKHLIRISGDDLPSDRIDLIMLLDFEELLLFIMIIIVLWMLRCICYATLLPFNHLHRFNCKNDENKVLNTEYEVVSLWHVHVTGNAHRKSCYVTWKRHKNASREHIKQLSWICHVSTSLVSGEHVTSTRHMCRVKLTSFFRYCHVI